MTKVVSTGKSYQSMLLLSELSGDDEDKDEDDDEEATPSSVAAAATTSKSTSKRGAGTTNRSSSNKQSNKKRKKSNGNLFTDDEVVRVLGEAHKSNKEKQHELVRHNTAMEKLKREEIDMEKERLRNMTWKGKNDELEYKSNMMEKYKVFKKDHGLSDKQILRLYPDMKTIIDAFNAEETDDEDDNQDEDDIE